MSTSQKVNLLAKIALPHIFLLQMNAIIQINVSRFDDYQWPMHICDYWCNARYACNFEGDNSYNIKIKVIKKKKGSSTKNFLVD